MQKIRTFFTSILIFSLVYSIFAPITSAFSWYDVYDYSEFSDTIKVTSSLSESQFSEGVIHFDTPRTTFIIAFDTLKSLEAHDIEVIWKIDGRDYSQFLDIEGLDDTHHVTTFPYVTTARNTIGYKIVYHTEYIPYNIRLISSYQGSVGKKLVYTPLKSTLFADNTQIVSRKEWGADESLRYASTSKVQKDTAEWIARGKTPYIITETEAQKASRIKADTEYANIAKQDSDSSTTYSLRRYENGNKLKWPIRKSKKVDRIVIHHTAENLEKVADDETLLRAIYFYHAVTKGWGDIGYNYVVGQRGKIYEGRSGGDYVEGAHVYGNNIGTVGISVMGNYEVLHLNRDQKQGLLTAIEYVARKYGIDVREQDIGATLCGSKSDCTWKPISTPRLIGHRDLAATSCPGRNIYDVLPELRNTIVGKVGKVSILHNTEKSSIEPTPPEDIIEYRIAEKVTLNQALQIPKVISSTPSKPIKIKLSYPHSSLKMQSAGVRTGRLTLDGKTLSYTGGDIVEVSLTIDNKISIKNGNSIVEGSLLSLKSDIVRINSWSRIPSWDTKSQYNDNIFRGNLILRNQGGNLLVVNELPLEDYLKGLGEVSNTDPIEKIKTIIVAARSYAYFYTYPKNRKYNTKLYDGSDNPDEFQKYLGYSYELRSPNVVSAVRATKGQVITYLGELIKAWYFSASDGKTRSYQEYCRENGGQDCKDIPYLQSVDDPAGVGKVRLGHGVGISGIGATYAAGLGKKYTEIIPYYLSGTKMLDINSLK